MGLGSTLREGEGSGYESGDGYTDDDIDCRLAVDDFKGICGAVNPAGKADDGEGDEDDDAEDDDDDDVAGALASCPVFEKLARPSLPGSMPPRISSSR